MAKHPFPWTEPFLAALREYPVLSHAAKAVDINRSTAWRRMEADPEFKAAVEEAMEEGIDRAEQEAFRRGVVGYEEPLTYQGHITYLIEHYDADTGELIRETDYDDNLLLPKEERKNYRWRHKLDAAGQPMAVTIRKHSDALLTLVLKGRRKRVFADRTELTGADGGPVSQVDVTAKAARIAALMALAQQRKNEQEQFGDLA